MDQLTVCTEEDVPGIAELHAELFGPRGRSGSEELRSHYKCLLFQNPWSRGDQSSLVYRSLTGEVVGFLGVVPLRMFFHERPISVAIGHRLMMAPGRGYALAAVALARAFLAGAQDLSISYGVTDSGRRIWEGLGGQTARLYNTKWVRPVGHWCSPPRHKWWARALNTPARVGKPVRRVPDAVARRPETRVVMPGMSATTEDELDETALLRCFVDFMNQYSLRTEHDHETVKWMLAVLRRRFGPQALKRFVVRNNDGDPVGACVYCLDAGKVARVLQIAPNRGFVEPVLHQLFDHARREGAVSLTGRVEPLLRRNLVGNHCVFKQCPSRIIFHSSDPEILDVIERGDAFLSGLENEIWACSPADGS